MMFFLIFSNADILFFEGKLAWRPYTITKALLITKRVQFINKNEFATVTLDKESNIFIVHIAFLEVLLSRIIIYLLQKA